jgi:hypothetical protein
MRVAESLRAPGAPKSQKRGCAVLRFDVAEDLLHYYCNGDRLTVYATAPVTYRPSCSEMRPPWPFRWPMSRMGHQLKDVQQIHGPLSKKSVDLGGVDGGPQWGITAHSIDDDLTASRAENRLRPNRGIISNSSRGSSRVYRRGHICCGAVLLVPPGYVSETPLSDTATYYNATFSSLGVTPGTYTWTWSTDTFTLDVSNSPVFVGMPGQANCQGQSLSSFTQQFGGLGNAASQLGFSSVSALRTFISGYCAGSSLGSPQRQWCLRYRYRRGVRPPVPETRWSSDPGVNVNGLTTRRPSSYIREVRLYSHVGAEGVTKSQAGQVDRSASDRDHTSPYLLEVTI